jgi:hypothetical protein
MGYMLDAENFYSRFDWLAEMWTCGFVPTSKILYFRILFFYILLSKITSTHTTTTQWVRFSENQAHLQYTCLRDQSISTIVIAESKGTNPRENWIRLRVHSVFSTVKKWYSKDSKKIMKLILHVPIILIYLVLQILQKKYHYMWPTRKWQNIHMKI